MSEEVKRKTNLSFIMKDGTLIVDSSVLKEENLELIKFLNSKETEVAEIVNFKDYDIIVVMDAFAIMKYLDYYVIEISYNFIPVCKILMYFGFVDIINFINLNLEDIIETDRIQDDEEELEINHDILIFIEENFFNRKEIQDNLRKIREIIKKEYQKNIELLSKDTEDLDKLRNAKMSLML
jgi:hypothetical protein